MNILLVRSDYNNNSTKQTHSCTADFTYLSFTGFRTQQLQVTLFLIGKRVNLNLKIRSLSLRLSLSLTVYQSVDWFVAAFQTGLP